MVSLILLVFIAVGAIVYGVSLLLKYQKQGISAIKYDLPDRQEKGGLPAALEPELVEFPKAYEQYQALAKDILKTIPNSTNIPGVVGALHTFFQRKGLEGRVKRAGSINDLVKNVAGILTSAMDLQRKEIELIHFLEVTARRMPELLEAQMDAQIEISVHDAEMKRLERDDRRAEVRLKLAEAELKEAEAKRAIYQLEKQMGLHKDTTDELNTSRLRDNLHRQDSRNNK